MFSSLRLIILLSIVLWLSACLDRAGENLPATGPKASAATPAKKPPKAQMASEKELELVTTLDPKEVLGLIEPESKQDLMGEAVAPKTVWQDRKGSGLEVLRRLDLDLDKEGNPIFGFEFQSKSDVAKQAELRERRNQGLTEQQGTVVEFGSDGKRLE